MFWMRIHLCNLDFSFSLVPRWSNLNHFESVMNITFNDGSKNRDISKVHVQLNKLSCCCHLNWKNNRYSYTLHSQNSLVIVTRRDIIFCAASGIISMSGCMLISICIPKLHLLQLRLNWMINFVLLCWCVTNIDRTPCYSCYIILAISYLHRCTRNKAMAGTC